MLSAWRASLPGSAGQLGTGWQPEPSCKVCRLLMPPAGWAPCPHPRMKSASLPSPPRVFGGAFHLCLLLQKGGRGSWQYLVLLISQGEWGEQLSAGRPDESHESCAVGGSLLAHRLLFGRTCKVFEQERRLSGLLVVYH